MAPIPGPFLFSSYLKASGLAEKGPLSSRRQCCAGAMVFTFMLRGHYKYYPLIFHYN